MVNYNKLREVILYATLGISVVALVSPSLNRQIKSMRWSFTSKRSVEQTDKFPSRQSTVQTSKPLTLAELVLNDYNKTQNATKLRKYAEVFEIDEHTVNDAFSIYERLEDRTSMQRVAKKYFIEFAYLPNGERLVAKSGLKLTPALYNERGDYQLNIEKNFDNAVEAYQKAGNQKGIEQVMQKAIKQ